MKTHVAQVIKGKESFAMEQLIEFRTIAIQTHIGNNG